MVKLSGELSLPLWLLLTLFPEPQIPIKETASIERRKKYESKNGEFLTQRVGRL